MPNLNSGNMDVFVFFPDPFGKHFKMWEIKLKDWNLVQQYNKRKLGLASHTRLLTCLFGKEFVGKLTSKLKEKN